MPETPATLVNVTAEEQSFVHGVMYAATVESYRKWVHPEDFDRVVELMRRQPPSLKRDQTIAGLQDLGSQLVRRDFIAKHIEQIQRYLLRLDFDHAATAAAADYLEGLTKPHGLMPGAAGAEFASLLLQVRMRLPRNPKPGDTDNAEA